VNSTDLSEQKLARLPKRRLTVDEFHRLGEAGILDEDDRIELIEGELIQMAPIGSLNAATVDRIADLYRGHPGPIIRVQNPLVLGSRSEPVPDLMLLRHRQDFYADSHPRPNDVLLLIEVADSTVGIDRDVKIPLYGQEGVAETWLLDLQKRQLEIYLLPGPAGYRQILRPTMEETVAPSLLPSASLRVADLFVK
jgi:Uma2 family endonuclease